MIPTKSVRVLLCARRGAPALTRLRAGQQPLRGLLRRDMLCFWAKGGLHVFRRDA
jgi:hypothetical protein